MVYCPSHAKSWVAAAHRSLTTPVIFAHISAKAKPISGAQAGRRGDSMIFVETDLYAAAAPIAQPMKKRPSCSGNRFLKKLKKSS